MADIVSKQVRSRMMSGIGGKGNTSTEIRLVRFFRKNRIKGWRRHQNLEGKPDFVFKSRQIAIFTDGCFWHGCPKCYKAPSSNRLFWRKKLWSNRKRDRTVSRHLKAKGWKVIRFWECSLDNEKKIVLTLERILNSEKNNGNQKNKNFRDLRQKHG